MIKLKPVYDAEATVIKYIPDKSTFSGMLRSLKVTDQAGRQFRIGSGFS